MTINTKKVRPADRRIAKTKQLLTDSLKALIIEKGYECVTVQDVLRRAQVGRSTFYSHYENIDQLLPCEDNFYRLLSEKALDNPSGINFQRLYEHVAENAVLAKVLLSGRGGDIVLGHLRNVLVWMIREEAAAATSNRNNGATLFHLMAEAAAAALVSLLVNWYQQGMPFSAVQMAQTSEALLQSILDKPAGVE